MRRLSAGLCLQPILQNYQSAAQEEVPPELVWTSLEEEAERGRREKRVEKYRLLVRQEKAAKVEGRREEKRR
jgi:hypothetical protein